MEFFAVGENGSRGLVVFGFPNIKASQSNAIQK
jgi:hypothetical protein